jgi:DNA-binding protein H-NS
MTPRRARERWPARVTEPGLYLIRRRCHADDAILTTANDRNIRMAIELKNLSKKQLAELIERAATRSRELDTEELNKVRADVRAFALSKGYTIEQLFGGRGRKQARRKAAPKYRNPADHSQTWSGRGKRPRWFHAALKAGRKEKDLLI